MEGPVSPHLFVGSLEGATSCAGAAAEFDIAPKLIVTVVIEGSQRFSIDGTAFLLDAAAGPVGLVVNVGRPARLRFLGASERPLSKVQISAPRSWLDWQMRAGAEESGPLARFVAAHLASARFTPNARILDLARQLMHPPRALRPEMRQLHRQSRGIDILCAALTMLGASERGRGRPRLAGERRAEEVRAHVLAHLDEALTVGEIARHVGASVSSAQRHFKSQYGVTISEFIRARRLERAREALSERGVTVAEAAHIAGYANSAHFSAAFKRGYGVPPSFHRR